MTGQAPMFVATLGGENDSGKLWVVDDRLCQRWQRWLDAKQYCFNFNVLAPPFIGRGMTV